MVGTGTLNFTFPPRPHHSDPRPTNLVPGPTLKPVSGRGITLPVSLVVLPSSLTIYSIVYVFRVVSGSRHRL